MNNIDKKIEEFGKFIEIREEGAIFKFDSKFDIGVTATKEGTQKTVERWIKQALLDIQKETAKSLIEIQSTSNILVVDMEKYKQIVGEDYK